MNPIFSSILCVFLLLCSFIYTAEEDLDPIEVRLATESALQPLYLSPLINEGADFPDSYLKQLEQVLTFDLNHTGFSYIVKRTHNGDQLVSSGTIEQVGSLAEWKAQNIAYVVKGNVQGRNLSAVMLNVFNQELKKVAALSLSGDLAQDRRQVHKLADMVNKAFFGSEGIASTKILYSVKVPGKKISDLLADIWEADYDGANARQLTKGGYYCISPTYLPPKAGFVTGGFMYVSYEIGQPKIYLASFKDLVPRRLAYLKGNQFMPTISRQRDKVAFISDVTGNPDLFIQPFSPDTGAVGKPFQVFSAKQATQGSPSFSPDGKRLAFVSDKDGSPRIYVIDIPEAGISLNDVKALLISKQNRENSAPCWSPDGTKIAYCGRSKGSERQIWMYDFKANKETQLTRGAGNKENPSWAPNSQHLVYNSSDTNASELYLININQLEPFQITSGRGEKRFPSWEPRVR